MNAVARCQTWHLNALGKPTSTALSWNERTVPSRPGSDAYFFRPTRTQPRGLHQSCRTLSRRAEPCTTGSQTESENASAVPVVSGPLGAAHQPGPAWKHRSRESLPADPASAGRLLAAGAGRTTGDRVEPYFLIGLFHLTMADGHRALSRAASGATAPKGHSVSPVPLGPNHDKPIGLILKAEGGRVGINRMRWSRSFRHAPCILAINDAVDRVPKSYSASSHHRPWMAGLLCPIK